MNYYELFISAENQEQADTILNSLLKKKLVTGGQFINTPARFWWKGKIVDKEEYMIITSFTAGRHKDAIIEDVRRTSPEDFPMIRFFEFDGNEEIYKWIEETLL